MSTSEPNIIGRQEEQGPTLAPHELVEGCLTYRPWVMVLMVVAGLQGLIQLVTLDLFSLAFTVVAIMALRHAWLAMNGLHQVRLFRRMADLNESLAELTTYFKISTILVAVLLGCLVLLVGLGIFLFGLALLIGGGLS